VNFQGAWASVTAAATLFCQFPNMAATEEPIKCVVTCDDILTNQLQPFLDEWYYRILASPVGKMWNRKKAMGLLLDVLGMIGVNIPADIKETLYASDDDAPLVAAIIQSMPGDIRASFEATALQIQTVLHEATRILSASEAEGEDEVTNLFDEAGSDRGGLTQQVLKSSVVYAAKEVAKLRKVHTSWRKNTDGRIDRLLGCAEEAEHAQQQLLACEAQLEEYKHSEKSKSKSLLLSMADGKESAMMHAVFSSWLGYVEKCQAEKEIRKRFQDQIDTCKMKLVQYKEAQMANVKGVLMRGAAGETEVLLHFVWKTWTDEVKERKAEGDTAEAMKAAQDKMNSFEQSQKEKAGQFMTRMAAGSDASLTNLCLEAWIKHHQDYAADRDMEDRVKKAEQAFKAHMDAKKDEAKAVMERMLAGTDHGLQCMIIQNWWNVVKEERAAKELEATLASSNHKFKSLNARQKNGVGNVQNRVNEQIALNLLQRVLNCWIQETKANRVEQHYNNKYESKRRQLQEVQNLFKSFAMQLEQNLGGDDDSSSRTNRRSKHTKDKGMNKGDGTVSLPDIHQKS